MSDKRAREGKRAEKKRDKARRREERRARGPQEVELATAEELTAGLRSIEETLESLHSGPDSRAAAPLPCKLFVGSLNFDTSSATLREAFEAHGPVADATVITDRATGDSRGFGFVTMADRKDAARAIEALDRSDLDGHSIVVRIATER